MPALLPAAMFAFGKPDLLAVASTWSFIIFCGSFFFGAIGLNAGHHHPDIIHEGDDLNNSMDFGVFQMNAVMDRPDVKRSHFMVLTHFGNHLMHHLFPTVDHGLLPQLDDIFLETCMEFEEQFKELPWYSLVVGQFQQLARIKPKTRDNKND